MANLKNLTDMSVYVGTYCKYNEGSLFGKWLNLSDYSDYDELLAAMRELHKDEEDPEFMIQDWEISPLFQSLGLVSESHISSEIYEVWVRLQESGYDLEIIEAYADCCGSFNSIDEILEQVEESYSGKYDSDEDFAEELLIETCSLPKDLPSYIYIDWERTARDIMMDYSTSNGYYFRNV